MGVDTRLQISTPAINKILTELKDMEVRMPTAQIASPTNDNSGEYRTQKALGINALAQGWVPRLTGSMTDYLEGSFVEMPPSPIQTVPYHAPVFPSFARPCPSRPRHGFVDSRPITTTFELLQMFDKAKRADADAEIVLMPECSARWSAVATNAGVTFGRSNDGATAGKAGCFHVPAMASVQALREGIGPRGPFGLGDLGINDCPYIEIVEDSGLARAVQLRDGPGQTTATAYIPKAVKVRAVLTPTENGGDEVDLLGWEAKVRELAQSGGGVVWLPHGSLSSHYAIHAIENGVPVLTSDGGRPAPQEGDLLEPVAEQARPEAKCSDIENIAEALSRFDKLNLGADEFKGWERNGLPKDGLGHNREGREYYCQMRHVMTAVATLHAMSFWDYSLPLVAFRAHAATTIVKFVAAACVGECRYFNRRGPGAYDSSCPDPAVPWERLMGMRPHGLAALSRAEIYRRIMKLPFAALGPYIKGAVEDFNGEWDPRESYGGRKWKNVAVANSDLYYRLNRLNGADAYYPSYWSDVVKSMNCVVSTAHNGGKVLTKWISTDQMTQLNRAPVLGLINPVAARIALQREKC